MAVLMPLARLCNVQLIDSPQLRRWKSCTHCDRKQVRGGCPSGDLWWWSSKENMHNELYLLYEKSVLAYLLALLTLSSKDEFGNLPVAALMQRNCFKTQSTLFSSIPVIENRESALTYRQSQTGFQIFVCLFQFLLCIGIVIRTLKSHLHYNSFCCCFILTDPGTGYNQMLNLGLKDSCSFPAVLCLNCG